MRLSERLSDMLFTLLLLAAAVMLAFLSTRFGWRHDFSADQRASLDPRTIDLLHKLDGPISLTSYAARNEQLRRAIADFVARYEHIKPDISLRFVDPDADPAATRKAGIQVNGEMILHYKNHREQLKVLTERSLDDALLRLARSGARLVGFLSGDGERKPGGKANADLGTFTAMLQDQGIRSIPLNLDGGAQIPQNLDLLVIAGPQVKLDATASKRLVDYVATGGNLLWLTEPGVDDGLGDLADALSLRVLGGTVVDGNSANFNIGDPSFVAITNYPHDAITDGFTLTTLFPQAAALAQISNNQWKLTPLLRTSKKSWTQIGPIPKQGATTTIRFDASKGEIAGPLDIGFALSRLSPSPAHQQQRVVVIGDGDFLSNSFLGNGGNREFGQRIFDWLLNDDSLIQLPDKTAPDRILKLSQTSLGIISFGFLIVLPGLLLLTGGLIWWRRRRG